MKNGNPAPGIRPGPERRRGFGEAGFTLVEVLVVLAILMSLTGIVSMRILRYQAQARVDATRIQIRQLHQAIRLYERDHGVVPTEEQGLDALVRRPTRPPVPEPYPDEGYLDSRNPPRDAWNRPFVYAAPGREGFPFEILSYGRDGRPGGTGEEADLSNLDL